MTVSGISVKADLFKDEPTGFVIVTAETQSVGLLRYTMERRYAVQVFESTSFLVAHEVPR